MGAGPTQPRRPQDRPHMGSLTTSVAPAACPSGCGEIAAAPSCLAGIREGIRTTPSAAGNKGRARRHRPRLASLRSPCPRRPPIGAARIEATPGYLVGIQGHRGRPRRAVETEDLLGAIAHARLRPRPPLPRRRPIGDARLGRLVWFSRGAAPAFEPTRCERRGWVQARCRSAGHGRADSQIGRRQVGEILPKRKDGQQDSGLALKTAGACPYAVRTLGWCFSVP